MINPQLSGNRNITWGALVAACASVISNSSQLLVLGRYGFSLANDRLLRAWETALAGMAEARPGDYIRDNINQCVASVFQSVFATQQSRIRSHSSLSRHNYRKIQDWGWRRQHCYIATVPDDRDLRAPRAGPTVLRRSGLEQEANGRAGRDENR